MVVELYHHPQSPPCAALRCLVRELGIDFKEHLIDFFADEHKSEMFKAVNPYQQLPALKDGDVILCQSRAIAIYLCQKYEAPDKKDKLYPTGQVQTAKFNALLFRDVDNFSRILKYANVEAIATGKGCGPNEDALQKAKDVLSEYDNRVANQDYMFGNHLTMLDFFCTGVMTEIALTGFSEWDDYPNLKQWKVRLAEKPYFQELLKDPTEKSKEMYKQYCEKAKAALAAAE